jgi:hypothetical protein
MAPGAFVQTVGAVYTVCTPTPGHPFGDHWILKRGSCNLNYVGDLVKVYSNFRGSKTVSELVFNSAELAQLRQNSGKWHLYFI